MQPRLGDGVADGQVEVGLPELARGEVHGDAGRSAGLLPLPRLAAGGLQRPAADRNDEPVRLREVNEVGRGNLAELGALPPQERLEPFDPPGRNRDDRLVEEPELAVGQGLSDGSFEGHCLARLLVQRGIEGPDGVPPVFPGAGGRDVGGGQERLGGLSVPGRDGEPAAQRDVDLPPVEDERSPRGRADLPDDDGRLVGVADLQEEAELVPREACHGVGLADGPLQPRPDAPEELVAEPVAERVVEELESVDVEREDGDGAVVAAGATESLGGSFEEHQAVREAREGVVTRHVLELGRGRDGGVALGLEKEDDDSQDGDDGEKDVQGAEEGKERVASPGGEAPETDEKVVQVVDAGDGE